MFALRHWKRYVQDNWDEWVKVAEEQQNINELSGLEYDNRVMWSKKD